MKKGILARIGQYADRIETAVASIAFAFMCLFVLTTIVYRYVLRQPISWTEEASRYLMITGIFVAMPVQSAAMCILAWICSSICSPRQESVSQNFSLMRSLY